MKKLLAIISSVAMFVFSAVPFRASAFPMEDYAAGGLGQVIESFGEGTLAEYHYGSYNTSAFVLTSDYKGYYFSEYFQKAYITVKEGTSLPVEEINERISPYSIKQDEGAGYTLYIKLLSDRKAAYDVLKEYDAVQAIDEEYKVRKVRDNLWSFDGIYLNTELNNEEIIAMLPELALTEDTGGFIPEGYMVHFAFSTVLSYRTMNEEFYNGLKKLMESGLDYKLNGTIADDKQEDYQSGTVNVYTAEAEETGTTTTTSTTTETTTTTTTAAQASADAPKTGDSGLAGVLLAGAGAAAMAFVMRKRKNG